MRNGIVLAGLAALAACAAPAPPRPAVTAPTVQPSYTSIGLERVLDQDAAGLTRLFGTPDAEVREGTARKLQFRSAICVLDAYLYPKVGGEPRVTYLDARTPAGGPIDRASCVAALTRRPAAR